jgi:hypothetical protein
VQIIPGGLGSLGLDGFLARPLFAFLGTASPDGPRVSPVWFLWEDGAFWIIGNLDEDTFPGRVESDPRSSLAIVDFDRTTGRVQHVGVRGSARVCPFDEARARRLLRRYLGPDETRWDASRFGPPVGGAHSVLVRLTPATVVSRDQSYDPAPDLLPWSP